MANQTSAQAGLFFFNAMAAALAPLPPTTPVVPGTMMPAADAAAFWYNNGEIDCISQNIADANGVADPEAIGGAMVFLSWLTSTHNVGKGIALTSVNAFFTNTPRATLAEAYASLTNDAAENAYPSLMGGIGALSTGVQNADPFDALNIVWPAPLPITNPLAVNIVNAVMAVAVHTLTATQMAAAVAAVNNLLAQ